MFKLTLKFLILCLFSLSVYSEDFSEEIENHFNIFLLNKAKRHKSEKIIESNGRVLIKYWFERKNLSREQTICTAYKWILLGRGKLGKGAKDAFDKFDWLKKITLNFYKVEFITQSDSLKGVINYEEKESDLIKILITKQTASSIEPDKVKKELEDEANCITNGEKYVSNHMYYF